MVFDSKRKGGSSLNQLVERCQGRPEMAGNSEPANRCRIDVLRDTCLTSDQGSEKQ